MPTAKKLPSGSWRCRVFSHYELKPDGKKKAVYESFTVSDPSKRGKKECERLASEWSVNHQDRDIMQMTVQDCVRRYIDLKEKVLSPSTIKNYEQILDTNMDEIRMYAIGDLTPPIVQMWINGLAVRCSPKYCRNANGLFQSSMKFSCAPTFRVTLPAPQDFQPHVPCDAEVVKLISYITETTHENTRRDMRPRYELKIAVMLAAFGSLRRGEICALTASDFDRDKLTVRINKDVVKDKYGLWVTKPTPKTSTSNRVVQLPDFVFDAIDLSKSGTIIKGTPDQISNRFRRAVRFSGAEFPFRFHDLRHYYVSIAHALGIPDAYIMEMGGWRTDRTMKRVYRSTLADRSTAEQQKLNDHFTSLRAPESAG